MWKDFKAPVAVIALVVTLAAAMLAYSLYNHYFIERPFEQEISRVSGVERVVIGKSQHKVNVTVTLKELEDFAPSYKEIEQLAERRFGSDRYSIEIRDARNEELQEFYGELQLYLYQGIANNSFLWLDKEIGRLAGQRGLRYKLSVDKENLYLQLHGKGSYMYEVIKRGEENSIKQGSGR